MITNNTNNIGKIRLKERMLFMPAS